jgi:hypothetical protein
MVERLLYQRLNYSRLEFRILKLLSVHPLKGTLQTCSLTAELPQYTALSYTWQAPVSSENNEIANDQDSDVIEIDGSHLLIKPNLNNALQYLHEHGEHQLWIDAICIDQTNNQERGHQVELMRRVYTEANKVTVWLGARTHDSDLAMDHLSELARGVDGDKRGAWISGLAEPRYRLAWVAFRSLLRRNWWKRAWVIQEVALARKIELVCGNRRISETQLLQAQLFLTDEWYLVFHSDVIRGIGMTSRDLEVMLHMVRIRIYLQQGKTPGLLPILRRTKNSEASNLRDLLFAKYGMMGDRAVALCAPDYDLSAERVCTAFAWAYIQHENDLSILCDAGISSNERRRGYPTWVPDWGHHRPAYSLACSWSGQATDWPNYKAAGDTKPSVRLCGGDRVLETEGILVDSVDGVQFDPWCHRSPERKEGSQSVSRQKAFGSNAAAFEALYRTVVADTYRREAPLDPIQADSSFGALFAKACLECDRLLEDLDEAPGEIPTKAREGASNIEKRWHGMRHLRLGGVLISDIVKEAHQHYVVRGEISERRRSEIPMWIGFEHSFGQAMYHRRLFTTANGRVGIGSRVLVAGDMIYVFKGCALPIIVRPVVGSEHYQVVGDCYIQGLMDSEALDEIGTGGRYYSWIKMA